MAGTAAGRPGAILSAMADEQPDGESGTNPGPAPLIRPITLAGAASAIGALASLALAGAALSRREVIIALIVFLPCVGIVVAAVAWSWRHQRRRLAVASAATALLLFAGVCTLPFIHTGGRADACGTGCDNPPPSGTASPARPSSPQLSGSPSGAAPTASPSAQPGPTGDPTTTPPTHAPTPPPTVRPTTAGPTTPGPTTQPAPPAPPCPAGSWCFTLADGDSVHFNNANQGNPMTASHGGGDIQYVESVTTLHWSAPWSDLGDTESTYATCTTGNPQKWSDLRVDLAAIGHKYCEQVPGEPSLVVFLAVTDKSQLPARVSVAVSYEQH
jgi:hypothetical protein